MDSDRCQGQDNSAGDRGGYHFGGAQCGGWVAVVSLVLHDAVSSSDRNVRATAWQVDGSSDDGLSFSLV